MKPIEKSIWQSPIKTILLSGFIAGSLDILSAFLVYVIVLNKTTAANILKGIASGIFHAKAFTGGTMMAFCGLLFHFIIAFCFAIFYFLIYRHIPFLQKQKIINGLLYGIFVWCVMNLLILPIVFSRPVTFKLDPFLIGASILMVMIGLPISIITNKYYSLKNANKKII